MPRWHRGVAIRREYSVGERLWKERLAQFEVVCVGDCQLVGARQLLYALSFANVLVVRTWEVASSCFIYGPL